MANSKTGVEKEVDRLLVEEAGKHIIKDFKQIRLYLLKVIKGKIKESKLVRFKRWSREAEAFEEGSEVVEFPISHAVRAKAAQVYKEIAFNKIVSDKRTIPSRKDTSGKVNHAAEAKRIAEKREKEKAAKKAGIKAGLVSEIKGGTGTNG